MKDKVINPARKCRICGAECEKTVRYCRACAREVEEIRQAQARQLLSDSHTKGER